MMEENVALDSQKQRKFVKSIKGIKKLIQKSKEQDETRDVNDDENQEASKPFSMRLKNEKAKKRTRKPKGLVYLSHIPHGFYEHQMTQYFKQFGMVTNARVIRSRRTGNSKGYAFVEFKDPSVAEIVAETMNNYLMGKRLIKAAYIPPEKQRRAFRKRWNALNNPANDTRLKMKKAYNADKDESGNLAKAKKLLLNLNKTKNRLREMGINYDFFTPVDVPEQLVSQIVKQEKPEDVIKKTNKEKNTTDKSNKVNDDKTKAVDVKKKSKEEIKKIKPVIEVPVKINKKEKTLVNVNKQEQKQKKQTLKEVGGAKALEEFIKLDEGSDDSDSSADFDSDEYEKALENEDDSDASLDDSGESENDDDDDDDDDDDGEEEEEESEEEEPPKKPKGRIAPVPKTATQPKKQGNKQQKILEVKRKAPQRSGGSPKKPKFEKQNQKPLKKQFKRK